MFTLGILSVVSLSLSKTMKNKTLTFGAHKNLRTSFSLLKFVSMLLQYTFCKKKNHLFWRQLKCSLISKI